MEVEPELRDFLLPFLDVDDPVVIRMRHEPKPAAAQLLVSLGAGWIIDPRAPQCVRSCGQPECRVVSAHDLLASKDCASPGCPREAVRDHDHCDDCIRNPPRPRVDDAELFGAFDDDEPHERRTPMSTVATATCKKPGCEQPANPRFTRGYQYGLCDDHATERGNEIAASRRGGGNGSTGGGSPQPPTIGDGYVARVRALIAPARSLDQARRKLEDAGSNEKLRASFQEATRNATASPNATNLARLEEATKALRKSAPAREAATAKFSDAERKFKLALADIARDFRAP